jgi:predicted metal-dependent hydrolase
MNRIQPIEPEFKVSAPKDNSVTALDINAIRQASALAESPLKWKSQSDLPTGTPERGSLLVSRRYLLKDGKLIDPLAEGSDQLHPPITNDWLLVNGLDYTDINIKEKDAEYYSVSYGNIVGVLIEAIKEQQIQIDELKKQIEFLKPENK